MRMINQEPYWTYKAPPTPDEPPPDVYPKHSWFSLSPGMRREIWRDYERRRALESPEPISETDKDRRQMLRDRKAAVRRAARQRL